MRDYYIIIDNDNNIIKVKKKIMLDCFDKYISPLDIISQVGNETREELFEELRKEVK